MNQHTPGPWKVWQGSSIVKEMDGYQAHIGFAYMPSFAERSETGRRALADARLMAAAPEMLAALKDVARHLNGEARDKDWNETTRLVLASIAKAEGCP